MLSYIKASLARKKARRVTQEYPPQIENFDLGKYGQISFANWSNPLVPHIKIHTAMVEFFNQFIKEGDLTIDIGANIGDTTVPMAICSGKSGLALGFDPNPFVFKILQKNASLNEDKYRLEPQNYAISTQDEEFYFVSSEASFANGAISPTKDSPHGKFVQESKVKGVNLKAFLESKYPEWVNKLSFIKIDTEGYDKEIIKSISDLIEQCKPVIIAESFGKASNDAKVELYDVIKKHGYDIFYFEDFDIHATVEKLPHNTDMMKFKKTINIYAVPTN
ncbi:FkbM family methyltransferase [Pedobacter glucosidilyticus]|uniref:FkbM family methyltransferase n=1 Tax=Pedobacter glucosidilyticus TaxID=1122941 RepID=UPI0026EFDC46|nr:FkbM family methyltransferase [Pedobacter glucosidilyticus]